MVSRESKLETKTHQGSLSSQKPTSISSSSSNTSAMEAPSIEMSYRKRSGDPSPSLPVASSNWAEAAAIDEPKPLGNINSSSTLSLSQLSPADLRNFLLLCLLYLLQGIPVGLAFGSVPFLLKSKLSFGQVGIFTLASYPYSLKLLWSPIVDAIYSRKYGRRKSWIIPIQTVSGFVLITLGHYIEPILADAERNLGTITLLFFSLVFLCATQDIAVDGWALTLLSKESLSYASTAQTIGLNSGYFMSFTVFLAFNSTEFANKYFRSAPLDYPLVSLSGYLVFWGWAYLATTIGVGLLKKEERTHVDDGGIKAVYKSMFKVLRLTNIQSLILVHLVAKIGFQANEAVTNLKLLEKGFSKEDLSLTVLIDFPFEIIFGYYAAKWSTGKRPLDPWVYGFMGRIASAFVAMLVVYWFPTKTGVGFGYLLLVIIIHVIGSFMSTVQFVSINAFHTQIADPLIGGTYMTTLNTIANLGGQWPRIIVLYAVDWFTKATCVHSSDVADIQAPFEPFSCATESGKAQCKTFNGDCNTIVDGYYLANIVCISVGLVLFFGYIKKKAEHLQSLPTSAWRIE